MSTSTSSSTHSQPRCSARSCVTTLSGRTHNLELEATLEKGAPATGEPFELPLPMVLVNQMHTFDILHRNHYKKLSAY